MNNFQKKIVEDALDDSAPLTEWEYDFINDIAEKEHLDISDKQNDILNRISQKYV